MNHSTQMHDGSQADVTFAVECVSPREAGQILSPQSSEVHKRKDPYTKRLYIMCPELQPYFVHKPAVLCQSLNYHTLGQAVESHLKGEQSKAVGWVGS